MTSQIDPDTNPVYQELVDTLFALNMSQTLKFYYLEGICIEAACLCVRMANDTPHWTDAIQTHQFEVLLVEVKHLHQQAIKD